MIKAPYGMWSSVGFIISCGWRRLCDSRANPLPDRWFRGPKPEIIDGFLNPKSHENKRKNVHT